MTMKMISSTNTTSTSGVTLMSERMEPPPPTCMSLSSLSGVLLRLSDQTDVVEADLAARFQDVENVAVLHELVAFDRDLAVGRALMNVLELRLHLILPHDVGAEVDRSVGFDGDLQLLVRVGRLLG